MNLDAVKKFVFDGVLATKELQELTKSIDTKGAELVVTSVGTESTDPAWYPPELVNRARTMTRAYYRLFLFENQVRRMVEQTLLEGAGPGWWDAAVPAAIKAEAARRREEEGSARFHGPRGDSLLDYVGLPDLGKIIVENWIHFQDFLYRKEWVAAKFEELRLTRNAVAHVGDISPDDFARLDVILADWNKQVA